MNTDYDITSIESEYESGVYQEENGRKYLYSDTSNKPRGLYIDRLSGRFMYVVDSEAGKVYKYTI